jgi:hypothetical protein
VNVPSRQNLTAGVFDGLPGALVDDPKDIFQRPTLCLGGVPAGQPLGNLIHQQD